MSGIATRANGSLDPEYAALAALAFASSQPADTRVAAAAGASFFGAVDADSLDLDLSDPDQCRFGDYTLRAKLGQGGMGVVYHAHQHSLDRDVAVKLLAAGPWASKGFVERFRQEAQSAARMQHPNIVTIHEIGEQDGLPFFSMRLVRGRSLAEKLVAGALAPREAAGLLRTVAEAVEYAHRLGVLHLDLKPGNVLLDEGGEPMVADFGLARRLEETLAGGDEISGTPSYMAPEQATAGQVGVGTDVYALGATLFEALNGRPPFRGASARETLEQVVFAALPAPREFAPGVPADLRAICLRCLRKNPAERYPSARALAEDLADFLRGREVKARPLNRPQKLLRLVRREPRLAALVMLFTGSLLLGLFATTVQWNRAEAGADSARRSLWRERAQAAEAALAEGNGFFGLQAMVANLHDMQASGRTQSVAIERQRIGTLLANAPQLIDRIPVEVGTVVNSVVLAPQGDRVAVATQGPGPNRSVRQYQLADGRLMWSVDTIGLTHHLSMASGVPHGRLRYSHDGKRLVAGLYQQPVFAAPGTMDEIGFDTRDGSLLRPATLPEGFSDVVYDEQAQVAILRWRTEPSLRFPDRLRFHRVVDWMPLGPEHSNSSSLWLFAPDTNWLLRTGDFQRFEALEFGSLALRWSLDVGDRRLVRAWRFSPDGRTLALGAQDGSVLLVDPASGAHEALPSSPSETVRWLEFDRDSRTLAALSENGQVVAWDLASRTPRAAPWRVMDMVHLGRLRLDDDQLAAVHGNSISLWHLPPLSPFGNDPMPMPARILGRRPFTAHAFDFDAGRRLLVSGGIEGALGVWRLPQAPLRTERAAPLPVGTPSFDGRHLVEVEHDEVRLVELDSGRPSWPALKHPRAVDFAELSHDGRWLVTIAGRTLRVFDAASGAPHREPLVLESTPLRADLARAAPVLLLVRGQHEEGRFFERAQVIDLEQVRTRSDGLALPWLAGSVHLDPRGRFALVAQLEAETKVVEMLDFGAAPACGSLELPDVNQIDELTIAADGQVAWISLSLRNRRAGLTRWDLATCRHEMVMEGAHLGMSTVLQARGDGVLLHRHLASALAYAGPEGLRARIPTLPASRTMGLLAVSADGRRAALATRNTVQVYGLDEGEALSSELTTALAGNDAIRSLAFSPDGSRLLARSIFGRWMSWPLVPTELPVPELETLALVLDSSTATRPLADTEAAALRARLRQAGTVAEPPSPSAEEPARVLAPAVGEGVDPRLVPLDLGQAQNVRMGKPWIRMAAQGGDLMTLSRGIHRLDGIDWRIEGAIQLSGGGPATSLFPLNPASDWVRVDALPARRAHVLMLQHIPMRDAGPRSAGKLELELIDGRNLMLEIQTVRDVVNHFQPDLAAPTARAAWRGVSATDLREGGTGLNSLIYHVVLDLPADAAPVQALRLHIGDGPMEAPLFYAVTMEVDAMGEVKP